jgi:hypothetical protein
MTANDTTPAALTPSLLALLAHINTNTQSMVHTTDRFERQDAYRAAMWAAKQLPAPMVASAKARIWAAEARAW